MSWITAYPVATISSGLFYFLLLLLAFPTSRNIIAPHFVHPIPPHQEYLRGFDTLRGFAAALVALGHFWWSSYPVFSSTQVLRPMQFIGYASKGVPMFAVLSGFLIYRSVLSIKSLQDLRDYTIRRFFRIYPVYVFAVIICLMLKQYVATANFTAPGYFVSDFFMLTIFNWPGGFANSPTWSLYIEMIFYAFLPLAVIVLGRRKMVLFSLIMIAAMVAADYPSRFFSLWKYFFIGIAASEFSLILKKKSALIFFCTGILLLGMDLQGPKYDWGAVMGLGQVHMDGHTLGLGLACGLILAALPHVEWAGKFLNILPLRLIGVISYSVYIIQFFYIKANFHEIALFSQLGTDASYQHFKTLPGMPFWYLPLVYLPGIFLWGAVSFLLIEKPAIRYGQSLLRRNQSAG